MNLTDLRRLVDFHYWARERVLDATELLTPEQFTRDLGSSFGSVRDTLAHLHSAEWTWHQRWIGASPTAALPADRFADQASLRAAWNGLEAEVRSVVKRLDEADVDRVLDFRTLGGTPTSATFGQMLQHLVNHGTYHRGQVTTLLRQLGAAPPKGMDLIAFFRERPKG